MFSVADLEKLRNQSYVAWPSCPIPSDIRTKLQAADGSWDQWYKIYSHAKPTECRTAIGWLSESLNRYQTLTNTISSNPAWASNELTNFFKEEIQVVRTQIEQVEGEQEAFFSGGLAEIPCLAKQGPDFNVSLQPLPTSSVEVYHSTRVRGRVAQPEDIVWCLGHSLNQSELAEKQKFFNRAIRSMSYYVDTTRPAKLAFRRCIFADDAATGKELPQLNDSIFENIKTMFYHAASNLREQLTFHGLEEQYRFYNYCSSIQAWLDPSKSFAPPTHQMITVGRSNDELFLTPENRTLLRLACYAHKGEEIDEGLRQFLDTSSSIYIQRMESLCELNPDINNFSSDKLLVRFVNVMDGLCDYSNFEYLFGLMSDYVGFLKTQQAAGWSVMV